MDRRTLPTEFTIDGVVCPFDADFRNVLDIFQIMNDPDLLDQEKFELALEYFYTTNDYQINIAQAAIEMATFLNGGTYDNTPQKQVKPLFDWEQDFDIIIPPINKIIGHDIRGDKFVHWWTFLSAFMEIGECTFSTFVSIRDKINRNIKLDKTEEKIYRDNIDKIKLKTHYDSTTQSLMDEIMGLEG